MEGTVKETANEALPSPLFAASETDRHIDRTNFCIKIQDAMMEEGYLNRVVFSDESTFHINEKVHRHNVCIWGTENPREMVNMKGLPQRSMFFAQCPPKRFMGLSFSVKTP